MPQVVGRSEANDGRAGYAEQVGGGMLWELGKGQTSRDRGTWVLP